ncbi:HesA/MoeB/ThiF family protein [Flavobacteriaceae bacterium]|nr:HesA/MoeB/ThiF family protein [Flavobacteriaceae bacterium]MDB9888624.1 HesA/MoeB/ThiF family protein [Flavobacteriaceae bacterium]MDB9903480.1 HesA/MoeB/ThiF family protein [Flavobacteriaceae bacterium]MDC1364185.1 HesA/MoeB/ThiF family protein [Flavobacteriaceae bacterium]MDC1394823.1 HesA/MoeB/ThiF family protein [Flavobacteriaceae bacterium]
MKRYSRHIALSEVGLLGQLKISESKVLVIGAGGLGAPLLLYLTAAGIGTIGIVDFDTISLSNLQRQVLYREQDLNLNKADIAKARLRARNSEINITSYPVALSTSNALEILKTYDIVVDCTDNFRTRYLINDACVKLNKPFVFAAIYKFEGQLSVFNYAGGPTYRCLFPLPPKAGEVPNCEEAGVLGVLPGILGAYQANEVLKIILNIGEVLSGKLVSINLLTNQQKSFQFKKNKPLIKQVIQEELSYIELNDCKITNEKKH